MIRRGIRRMKRTARRLRNRVRPGGLLLLYHRIADVDVDPWSLCVSPRHFAEHLDVLRSLAEPMHLAALLEHLQGDRSTRPPVAITFDDGYADNVQQARPLLERNDTPAVVFVTTGHTGSDREFWWDALEGILTQPVRLPAALHLHIKGKDHHWKLSAAAQHAGTAHTNAAWKIDRLPYPSPRHDLYLSLWQLLHPLDPHAREDILASLRAWAGAAPSARPTHRAMTHDEVRSLARDGLVEIGAHTVSHPSLSAHTGVVQQSEIQQSKTCLEALLGIPIQGFAYPYGDYTDETAAFVKEAGFAYACTTEARSVRLQDNRFALPRFEVRNWNGDTFAKRLLDWYHE
jgi:peptidoglycan/xylan/chitin deacetylase (PgdA/CDA1 family)